MFKQCAFDHIFQICVCFSDLSNYCSHSVDLCSGLKQKVIYNVAKMHGYNVLALAQNLDDMAAR